MNNPLELLLRRQKAAQGGRVGLVQGGLSQGQTQRGGLRDGPRGFGGPPDGGGNKDNNPYGGGPGGLHSGYAEDDTSVSDDDTSNNNNQNQNQTTTTTDEKQYTHNFLDALFNKDLSFKFDPKMDYVNRVYGGLNDVQKNRILNKIDPTGDLFGGDFDAFSSMAANDLYSKDNFSLKGVYDNVKDYFTGIPDAIANYNPQMPTQEGLVDLAKNVGYQGLFNPAMAVITGNPFSLFGSIVLGKGPYNLTKEGTYDPSLGAIADLTNAPANYVDAISNYQGGLTGEQMAQIASGEAAKAEVQKNTKSGNEPTAEERAALQAQMDAQSTAAYKNTLTEQQLRVYERLEAQGYTDDYIRAYLGFL